jgi:nucleotide-binding universal stress UspA family protein
MSPGRIVVGVDGSEGARRALRWAVDEARLRDAALEAIFVFTLPPSGAGIGMAPEYVGPQIDQIERDAAEELRSEIDAVIPREERNVETITRVESGRPSEVLVKSARTADLLVVGARGIGGFRGLLLGSVSQQCVTHAPCPVVVVPFLAEQD